jgi:D-beta-D-heptose 7-phosphate kinase/D-beta-D-heptose 1-phosphate adenosyltransferase
VLVVGINTDDSVRRLKGSGRPLNCEMDRAGIVAGLRCVDFVVLFDEDTPYQLIQELQPDVLTKGGDYDCAAVVGRDLVAETHVLGLVPGRSTSSLIDKVLHRSHGRPIDITAGEPTAQPEYDRWEHAPPAVVGAET